MVRKGFQVEIQSLRCFRTFAEARNALSVLKYEGRDLVLADSEQQLRARALADISHASADQVELSVLQLRQIKSKRKLAFEPGLHGVAVG